VDLPAREHPLARAVLKRVFDLSGALCLGALAAPIAASIVLVLALAGTGVFYRQTRIGRCGKTFRCLKFRTMVPGADDALSEVLNDPSRHIEWENSRKLRSDPRVTPVGKFLRRWSLDELPQLWNVVRGEMSIVGPRPVVPDEMWRYGRRLTHYLSIKPGLTGLWQATRHGDTSYRRRIAMDVYYACKQSALLDLYIILRTPLAILSGSGAC
jgi:undecaprenyl-phosphate galactose phosphotransferase